MQKGVGGKGLTESWAVVTVLKRLLSVDHSNGSTTSEGGFHKYCEF